MTGSIPRKDSWKGCRGETGCVLCLGCWNKKEMHYEILTSAKTVQRTIDIWPQWFCWAHFCGPFRKAKLGRPFGMKFSAECTPDTQHGSKDSPALPEDLT